MESEGVMAVNDKHLSIIEDVIDSTNVQYPVERHKYIFAKGEPITVDHPLSLEELHEYKDRGVVDDIIVIKGNDKPLQEIKNESICNN